MLQLDELAWELNIGGKGSQTNLSGDRSVGLSGAPASTGSLRKGISQAGRC